MLCVIKWPQISNSWVNNLNNLSELQKCSKSVIKFHRLTLILTVYQRWNKFLHWNRIVVILAKFSSPDVLEFVMFSGADHDKNFVKWHFRFNEFCFWLHISNPVFSRLLARNRSQHQINSFYVTKHVFTVKSESINQNNMSPKSLDKILRIFPARPVS